MILGSGTIVHNLRLARFGDKSDEVADWNLRFDTDVQKWIMTRDFKSLINYEKHPDFRKCCPTTEHFLPLIVVAGASEPDDEPQVVTKGYECWSLSATSFAFTRPM